MLLWLVVGCALRHAPPVSSLTLPPHPRVLVVAPHPDDEVLGVGGLLYRLTQQHVPVRVVFVTNGDGFPQAVDVEHHRHPTGADYLALGQRRQREALAATRQLGLPRREVRFLGFPDGGLAPLWRNHWSRPYTSPYTREDSPPYRGVVQRNVDYDGRDLVSVLSRELRDFRPSVVVMPHPYDEHLDHKHASYFVTEAVSGLVDRHVLAARPTVITYLVHYPSWPPVQGLECDRARPVGIVPDTQWTEAELTPAEFAAKRAALGEYRSQLDAMGGFLWPFLCRNELYARVDDALLARIASVH